MYMPTVLFRHDSVQNHGTWGSYPLPQNVLIAFAEISRLSLHVMVTAEFPGHSLDALYTQLWTRAAHTALSVSTQTSIPFVKRQNE